MSKLGWIRGCALAAAALLALRPARAQTEPAQALPGASEIAAHAGATTLSWAEFDALIVDRHAMSDMGRAALGHLLRAKLLERLASESKLVVSEAEVDRKVKELEREIGSAEDPVTLDAYLAKNRVTLPKFREFLRLALVQERLARRALGIPDGRPINGEQQEMWLDQVVDQRGTQLLGPPWNDGVAARCGEIEVRARDFVLHLRQQLDLTDVRDDCYQALLAKCLRARMPDLSPEAYARALEAELARRRAAIEADPQYAGVQFEQLMAAQGLSLEALRRDPAIVTSALAHVWVDREHDDASLRRVYDSERATFDREHGEAFETLVLFQRAAVLTNKLNPRSFDEAEIEVAKLARQITTRADFERLARARSEDLGSRDKGGSIGYVAAGDERVPEALRAAVFQNSAGKLDSTGTQGSADQLERLVGPVRLSTGVALVWVGQRRPAPVWDEMASRVHEELRRRCMEQCVTRKDVITFLDEE